MASSLVSRGKRNGFKIPRSKDESEDERISRRHHRSKDESEDERINPAVEPKCLVIPGRINPFQPWTNFQAASSLISHGKRNGIKIPCPGQIARRHHRSRSNMAEQDESEDERINSAVELECLVIPTVRYGSSVLPGCYPRYSESYPQYNPQSSLEYSGSYPQHYNFQRHEWISQDPYHFGFRRQDDSEDENDPFITASEKLGIILEALSKVFTIKKENSPFCVFISMVAWLLVVFLAAFLIIIVSYIELYPEYIGPPIVIGFVLTFILLFLLICRQKVLLQGGRIATHKLQGETTATGTTLQGARTATGINEIHSATNVHNTLVYNDYSYKRSKNSESESES